MVFWGFGFFLYHAKHWSPYRMSFPLSQIQLPTVNKNILSDEINKCVCFHFLDPCLRVVFYIPNIDKAIPKRRWVRDGKRSTLTRLCPRHLTYLPLFPITSSPTVKCSFSATEKCSLSAWVKHPSQFLHGVVSAPRWPHLSKRPQPLSVRWL